MSSFICVNIAHFKETPLSRGWQAQSTLRAWKISSHHVYLCEWQAIHKNSQHDLFQHLSMLPQRGIKPPILYLLKQLENVRTKESRFFLKCLNIFLKFYFTFKLDSIVLVLPNIEMNLPQVYMCSPSWTLLPPPSPYHPSGSSQCTSPKHPVSCFKLWCH